MPEAEARTELLRCAGTQFDPGVVDAFLGAVSAMPMSSGSVAAAA
jgi:HD-GYP domain-containing protein (c-di-GMP phosphodiesterase class II)